jgi:hypothetical protein
VEAKVGNWYLVKFRTSGWFPAKVEEISEDCNPVYTFLDRETLKMVADDKVLTDDNGYIRSRNPYGMEGAIRLGQVNEVNQTFTLKMEKDESIMETEPLYEIWIRTPTKTGSNDEKKLLNEGTYYLFTQNGSNAEPSYIVDEDKLADWYKLKESAPDGSDKPDAAVAGAGADDDKPEEARRSVRARARPQRFADGV